MQPSDRNKGAYTLEGAFAITIFTALFMVLLSLISIIRVEMVVQSAINQTTMQLSEYSYAVVNIYEALEGEKVSESEATATSLYALLMEMQDEIQGHIGGSLLCKTFTRENFNDENYDEWLKLQGVENGYEGLNFSVSNVLGDGENICVTVIYKLKVNTFGLYDKSLAISQTAQTRAWLPPKADEFFSFIGAVSEKSIWHENSFVRGKYFVEMLKSAEPDAAVESGQGIDLYYKSDRIIVEIVSMNVFSPSYSQCNTSDETLVNNSESYIANTENIRKQLERYAHDFNEDIVKTERLIQMEDGSLGNFGKLREKRLILVVPVEAKQNVTFRKCFDEMSNVLFSTEGVTLEIRYMEEALI